MPMIEWHMVKLFSISIYLLTFVRAQSFENLPVSLFINPFVIDFDVVFALKIQKVFVV
jgi:hypothetical protein